MSKIIYSTKDVKMGEFVTVFIHRNEVEMRRGLEATIATGKTHLSLYPQDFEIYQIGEVDQQTGRIIVPASPVFVCSVVQALQDMERNVRIAQDSARSSAVADLGNQVERLARETNKFYPGSVPVQETENMRKVEGSDK